ncbi:hypothetical protein [Synechococcus sp. NOUM97013]|uniref:hypothetical protein n=1 Tax=Synechococcus sp. NOUM97013 TaxID=1442555 RepID=UPI001645F84E|nr:hypothetical protein [Synechococcus sp. NOUM97013]QNI73556.1 hypothetical protein SynNOUM97013_01497 [Synechococcus sp. NOUM97013]
MPLPWPIPLPRPLSLENVDTLTGTPEADNFKLEPPGFETQSLDDDFIPVDIDFANNLIALGIPTIVDLSEDTEVDLLVYQEADGPEYFPGFTDPLARSYTLIENFDPVEDQILVDGGRGGFITIMSDENDIPMLNDVIEPSLELPPFEYDPFNPIVAFGE